MCRISYFCQPNLAIMIEQLLTNTLTHAIEKLYGQDVPEDLLQIQKTRPEFEGDFTIVVFPLLRISRKNPEQTANELGNYIVEHLDEVDSYNVIKGFLNLVVSEAYWLEFFESSRKDKDFGFIKPIDSSPVVVEFSSPNTNKPLHLGHVRNNLLGASVSKILKASGQNVVKVNLVNDRGIHICKSMLAWQKWGEDKTPETENLKGDKLVGDFYVKFNQVYKKEIASLIEKGLSKDDATLKAPLLLEAKQMLKQWEDGDEKVRELWARMNGWVYDGFDVTYQRMGINFDKTYYESETYLLGKIIVEEGLNKNAFFKKEDGSVWCDLSDEGLDEKLLLRADGTSVYMTQDLGTAQLRYDEFRPSDLIYVVGNEQNYHFDVLKLLLKKTGRNWAENIHHLSYGMVELPHGKMKSREGTVVDADDLMTEMYETAERTTEELGKFDDFTPDESKRLYHILSQGALKYFILKVDPKKNMTFNPEESIDFNGHTGPFIQYTHARIKSILRKAFASGIENFEIESADFAPGPKEKTLLRLLYEYPHIIQQAANGLSPALIANFAYDLAKEFNQFYHESPILKETDPQIRNFRLGLSAFVGNTIQSAMGLLGIEVPERM